MSGGWPSHQGQRQHLARVRTRVDGVLQARNHTNENIVMEIDPGAKLPGFLVVKAQLQGGKMVLYEKRAASGRRNLKLVKQDFAYVLSCGCTGRHTARQGRVEFGVFRLKFVSLWSLVISRLCPSPTPTGPPSTHSLRFVSAGTLFLTDALSLPSHPRSCTDHTRSRVCASPGRQRPAVLSVLSQLHADKCWLVTSLGGSQEARALTRELEAEGVSTRYCKVWEGAGVPAAWILHTSAFIASGSREGWGNLLFILSFRRY